jgi:hypothetical protein
LVQQHVKDEGKFAELLLREGVEAMSSGHVETAKTMFAPYTKATIEFGAKIFGPRPQGAGVRSAINLATSGRAVFHSGED